MYDDSYLKRGGGGWAEQMQSGYRVSYNFFRSSQLNGLLGQSQQTPVFMFVSVCVSVCGGVQILCVFSVCGESGANIRCSCGFRHFCLDPVSDFSVLLGVQRRDGQPLKVTLVTALVIAYHHLGLLAAR